MKRILSVLLVVVIVAVAGVLAGCGGEGTEVTSGSVQSLPDGTASTQPGGDTVEDAADGDYAIPEASPGSYTDLTPEQAARLIDSTPELVIVDVSPVYADGHLPGAVNYYIGDGSLAAALSTLDKTAPYLVYCHVDSASIGGAELMVSAGFQTVYRLAGNYAAWVAAGYPVEK